MATILPPRDRLGPNICADLSETNQREWLVTNGLGSYACGTVSGILTRRYHGLLIANLCPPLGRRLVFAKAEATLIINGKEYPLFSNCWRASKRSSTDSCTDAEGHHYLRAFELDGRMPVWHFEVNGIHIERRIWMEPGADTVYVAYRLHPSSEADADDVQIKTELLINGRDHHEQTNPDTFKPIIEIEAPFALHAHLNDEQAMHFTAIGGHMYYDPCWKKNFFLQEEQNRGLPAVDHHYCVGNAIVELTLGRWAGVMCSVHEDASIDLRAALNRFRSRDIEILKRAKTQVPEMKEAPVWINRLLLASDSFVFARPIDEVPNGESVIAGYPWFGDWGRDTMVSLPGLCLATGRTDSARRILQTFGRFVDRGMIPNVFPGNDDEPQYNSVDAALWYIEAWRSYLKATRDLRSLHKIYPVLQRIIIAYLKGTRFGIQVDQQDGLLYCGEQGTQLTWMDAKVNDEAVTPRIGKPVEVNALWFNAINTMTKFAYQLGLNPNPYGDMVKKTMSGFQRFVRAHGQGLYDVIDGPGGHDDDIRPNQILAVSLAYSALDEATMADVVSICRKELLTSYGLRTLPSGHGNYQPRYKGNVSQRDSAYHQGCVWPWLLGHYALAEYRVHRDPLAAQSRLEALAEHLMSSGMGTISELLDGTSPHQPRGALAQAWSVACTLEAWWKLEKAKSLARRIPTTQMMMEAQS